MILSTGRFSMLSRRDHAVRVPYSFNSSLDLLVRADPR
jgi:hypothetical protein